MTKLGTILVFIICSVAVYGQQHCGDPTTQFTKGQYKKDLRQLVKLIEKNHPQTYSFIQKKEFRQLVKKKSKTITDTTSIGQFLWICEDVAASIQCGHNFVWWPKDFGLIPDSLLFPVDTWTDGYRLFVSDARNNIDKIVAGTEILSINDVSFEKLLKAMYDSSPSDGNIKSSKRNWVNKVFNTMCPMYFNYPETYTIRIEEDGEIKTIQLGNYKWQAPNEEKNSMCASQLCLEMDENEQVGILTIKSFDYYEDDFAVFKSFIDSSFIVLNSQRVKQLIIDLRGNGGGDSKCGSYLIEHFANSPYCYWPSDSTVTWQKDLHNIIQPNKNRFRGTPYVLIDGGGFSTTGHVCSIIKEHQFGILVGEELGSTYTCNDNSLFGTLKHTSFQYRIPRTTFTTCANSFPKNKGILPDIEVLPTINDIVKKTDPQMKYVMEQIEINR